MASRAGNRSKGAGGKGSLGSAVASASALPVALRLAVVGAALLLVVSTVITATRFAGSGPSRQSRQGSADLLAARADAAVQPLRIAGQAALDSLTRSPDEPLDAAEQALRLARPTALGAAVLQDGQLAAQSGSPPAGADAWKRLARRAGSAPVWIGPGSETPGRQGLVYVVLTAQRGGRRDQVALAADLQPLMPGASAGVRVLAARDGAILASSGVGPNSEAGAANVTGLGLDPARLAFGGSASLGRGARRAPVAVVPAADGALVAVAGEPGGAASRALAVNLYSLLAPILIGCGLVAMLLFQVGRAQKAQAAQTESERKFRLAVEAAHCGIWEWRLREERVFMSEVTGVMLGWGGGGFAASEDVLGRIAPEHRERVRQAIRNAATFGALDVSFCVPRPDGAMAWIDARGQAFGEPDAQGYPTLMGVALDVTEERDTEHRAQAAERRLHDAIDSVSEAFVLWDRQDRLLMCNQPFREFFSLEPRFTKPGASREAVQRIAGLALRQSAPADARRGPQEVELTDGRWLQISERRTAEGGLVMTAADITAVKRQEQAARRSEEALKTAVGRLEQSGRELTELAGKYQAEKIRAESANTAKSEFLANMSHELRTPLNAVNGFSEMMVNEMFGPLGDRRYREYARDILASGQHLLALINDILDMSKIEAGKLTLNFDWVVVEDVVADAMRLMRNRAEDAGLELAAAVAHSLPEMQADYRAVKQVLLNLLSNALKFTPAGGRIEVKAWALGPETGEPRIRFSVADTGIGIKREDIGRLARPFEQIESQQAKTQQGTGLGLALTRSLIELHGGVFELESEVGLGTTVTFTLPLRQPETQAKVEGPTSASPAQAGAQVRDLAG